MLNSYLNKTCQLFRYKAMFGHYAFPGILEQTHKIQNCHTFKYKVAQVTNYDPFPCRLLKHTPSVLK